MYYFSQSRHTGSAQPGGSPLHAEPQGLHRLGRHLRSQSRPLVGGGWAGGAAPAPLFCQAPPPGIHEHAHAHARTTSEGFLAAWWPRRLTLLPWRPALCRRTWKLTKGRPGQAWCHSHPPPPRTGGKSWAPPVGMRSGRCLEAGKGPQAPFLGTLVCREGG